PEGNARKTPLREIWTRKGAFAYNREFDPSQLRGFCGRCEYGDICRAGCKSMAFAMTASHHENPMCVHRVRVERGLTPLRPRTPVSAGAAAGQGRGEVFNDASVGQGVK
ncbi:SPASM domain-containing protein, partial [Planctomycetota bacterium]